VDNDKDSSPYLNEGWLFRQPLKDGNGMKLAPHEILHYLGFDVPPEGIEIHPNDIRLHAASLRALGTTIDVSAIPDSALSNLYVESLRLLSAAIDVSSIQESALCDLHTGFARLVEVWRGEEHDMGSQPDASVADWLRELIASNLVTIYKQYGKRQRIVVTPLRAEKEDTVIPSRIPNLFLTDF
jgi:hypothetical protein